MPNPTRKYICAMLIGAEDPNEYIPQIKAQHPGLSLQAIENHFADPVIPTGYVRCTVQDVSIELHDQIMEIPGVENVT